MLETVEVHLVYKCTFTDINNYMYNTTRLYSHNHSCLMQSSCSLFDHKLLVINSVMGHSHLHVYIDTWRVHYSIGGGRVGPGRAMPDQKYGREIFNDVIIINNNKLIN